MTLRLLLGIGWVLLLAITIAAVLEMGLFSAVGTFIGDFAHPWRAQFHSDFALHLLLFAAWAIYRARSWKLGLVWAALTLVLGALFTLPYLIAASIQARGNTRKLLLGRHERHTAGSGEG